MWKEKQSYKTKTESTEELEPAENIELGDKGMLKLKYKSIKQLRDFFLDGTEIEVIERKIYYQAKDFDPEAAAADAKKKNKNKKEEKKEEPKDKKKKNVKSSVFDNYNQVNVEENTLATFKLELKSLLDGQMRELEKKYTIKLKTLEPIIEQPQKKDSKDKRTPKESKKSASTIADKGKKKQELEPEVPVELPPMELNLKFQVVDFSTYKELKNYFYPKNT